MDAGQCKDCKYSEFPNEPKDVMYCRRMPPMHEPMLWPLDDWCGEFEPKEEQDE